MSSEHLSYTRFTRNKYFKWYCAIIANAVNRSSVYDSSTHEKHHALPESFGGKDTIILTHREHYICHELLTRFTVGKDKMRMCFALHTFFHFDYHRPSVPKSRLYESHRKIFSEMCRERQPICSDVVFTFKNKDTGVVFTGTRQGFKYFSGITNQEIYNLLDANKKSKRWNSKSWGVFNEENSCFSYELPTKERKIEKMECEHCHKSISRANYNRWHGKNCVAVNPKLHEKNTQQIKNLRLNINH